MSVFAIDPLLDYWQMHAAGFVEGSGDAIISAQINTEKNFAFLEFRNVKECTSVSGGWAPIGLDIADSLMACLSTPVLGF